MARVFYTLTDWRALAAEGGLVVGGVPYLRDMLMRNFGYLWSEADDVIMAITRAINSSL